MAEEERLTGSSSSGPSPDPCSICLSPTTQESFLDQCFHKFCYHCIVKWINIVARVQSCTSSTMTCPLCKRHYVGKSLENSEFFSEAHRYRLKCYYTDSGDIAEKFQVSLYWKFRKYLRQNHFLADWLRREIQAVMQVFILT
ncbi:E3 ubiquitin-protein ligase Topors-like [Salvia splendens]|uniref:E3 ubiquitin-protein ligase Topors-like n=1 Tax=Salvia splendens TaxID=180675 RepID=UPI001C259DD9|nr:E3 ubiquitin-protein ligase Topors-like [Salvia splendens]